ncbi:hypothetical protein [Trinickia mobilis]|uniref:hypothetical protein n=1 Tax=Trinickia mobilis TaxID=2816356 RepID=UPI001A8CEAC8|nr:hypothetical protein [Trinickia mobilis]
MHSHPHRMLGAAASSCSEERIDLLDMKPAAHDELLRFLAQRKTRSARISRLVGNECKARARRQILTTCDENRYRRRIKYRLDRLHTG